MCPFFGPFSEIKENQLPLVKDVIKYVLFTQNDLKTKFNGRNPTNYEVFLIVSTKVQKIWESASIPVVSRNRIIQIIKIHYEKYLTLKRYPNSKKNSSYNNKLKDFITLSSTELYDIASCKCNSFDNCRCDKDSKVPVKERLFLLDQRSERKMVIGTVDKLETVKIEKRLARKERDK